MSILTPLEGTSRVYGSCQVFDEPSDAYKPFECGCGGMARTTETPRFDRHLLSYDTLAECGTCRRMYFVVGVADSSMMDEARLTVMSFFSALDKRDL